MFLIYLRQVSFSIAYSAASFSRFSISKYFFSKFFQDYYWSYISDKLCWQTFFHLSTVNSIRLRSGNMAAFEVTKMILEIIKGVPETKFLKGWLTGVIDDFCCVTPTFTHRVVPGACITRGFLNKFDNFVTDSYY